MFSFIVGWLLCVILSFSLIITSFVGGGVILAGIFGIPMWVGSIIFGIGYIVLIVVSFYLMTNESNKE